MIWSCEALAKVNLGLEITGRRPDGYHLLKTVFQTIDLADTLFFEPRSDINWVIGGTAGIDWSGDNTLRKVVDRLGERGLLGHGFNVWVDKRIPWGAGLGGGSADAAVLLLFLDTWYGLDLGREELLHIGGGVGADVPFFLHGGRALAEGVGEQITPLEDVEGMLFLVTPPIHASTVEVFRNLDLPLTGQGVESTMSTFLNSRDPGCLRNHLEETAMRIYPELRVVRETLLRNGAETVVMSGSGSALLAWFPQSALSSSGKPDVPCGSWVRMVGREAYRKRIGASPSGKALVFGTGIRGFESFRPRGK